jgi:hypothetical protein
MHPVARVSNQCTYSEHYTVQQNIISSILKINSILIPLILFLKTYLNILAFYTTTCFRLTVTTAFALLYI